MAVERFFRNELNRVLGWGEMNKTMALVLALAAGASVAAVGVIFAFVLPPASPQAPNETQRTAAQINLSPDDMPGWQLGYDGDAGFQRPNILDQSGRSFTKGFPSGSLIVGAQVVRFTEQAGALAFYEELRTIFQGQNENLELPSNPRVGTQSLYRNDYESVVFQRENVVVTLEFDRQSNASELFAKGDLMALAPIVDARI